MVDEDRVLRSIADDVSALPAESGAGEIRRHPLQGVDGSVLAMAKTLEQSVDIAAPVDRVWDLVSTSGGLSSWFTDATVVPGPQGSVTLRFAPGAEATVPVLTWDPPRRIRFGIAGGGRVHDITVVAVGEGCQVRLCDEGVSDGEAEATVAGWTGFLGKLRTLAEAGG